MNQDVSLLRQEIELLMEERQQLLKVAGLSALMIAGLDSEHLPVNIIPEADRLSTTINLLPQETLQDALHSLM